MIAEHISSVSHWLGFCTYTLPTLLPSTPPLMHTHGCYKIWDKLPDAVWLSSPSVYTYVVNWLVGQISYTILLCLCTKYLVPLSQSSLNFFTNHSFLSRKFYINLNIHTHYTHTYIYTHIYIIHTIYIYVCL